MQVGRLGDQRQKRNAANRGPPDPPVRARGSQQAPNCEFTSEHALGFGYSPPRTHRDHDLTRGSSHRQRGLAFPIRGSMQIRSIEVQVGSRSRIRNGAASLVTSSSTATSTVGGTDLRIVA